MQWLYQFIEYCNANSQALKSIGSLGTLLAALLALVKYRSSQRKSAERHEQSVFDSIDATYLELNKLMLQHPELDVSWFAETPNRTLSDDQKLQQYIFFEMITRLFERAFLVYRTATHSHRARQWDGWSAFIEDYCKKESFNRWWNKRDWPLRADGDGDLDQYDLEFLAFMQRQMIKAERWRETRKHRL